MRKLEQSHLGLIEIVCMEPRRYHSVNLGLGSGGAGCVSSTEEIVSFPSVTAIELLQRCEKRVGKRSTICEAPIISSLLLTSISSLFLSCNLAKQEENIISANLLVAWVHRKPL